MRRAVIRSLFEEKLELFRNQMAIGISRKNGSLDWHIQQLNTFSKELGAEIPKDVLATVGQLKKEARLRRRMDESKFRQQGFTPYEIKSQRGVKPSAMKKRRK